MLHRLPITHQLFPPHLKPWHPGGSQDYLLLINCQRSRWTHQVNHMWRGACHTQASHLETFLTLIWRLKVETIYRRSSLRLTLQGDVLLPMISDIQEILLKKHIVDHFLAKNTHAFMAFFFWKSVSWVSVFVTDSQCYLLNRCHWFINGDLAPFLCDCKPAKGHLLFLKKERNTYC